MCQVPISRGYVMTKRHGTSEFIVRKDWSFRPVLISKSNYAHHSETSQASVLFATWLFVARLVGLFFDESAVEAIDVSTVIAALAFIVLIIYSKHRSNHRSGSH